MHIIVFAIRQAGQEIGNTPIREQAVGAAKARAQQTRFPVSVIPDDLRHVIEKAAPEIVIPMHTDAPQKMQTLCQNHKVILLKDREELLL